jgi:hypothetical protein
MPEPALALLARALDAEVEPPDDAISERVSTPRWSSPRPPASGT